MEQPLVSIIVPIYNAEKTLTRCLSRIRNQTYKRIEVILVDDGSTDGSADICQNFVRHDSRFRLLRQSHQGVAAGRNLAMAEANGDFLQVCGGAEWMPRGAPGGQVGAAVGTGSELVTAGFYRVTGSRVYEHSRIGVSGILTRDEFVEHMMRAPGNFYYGVLWNKLYKRALVRRRMLACPEDLSWCEDTSFNFQYLQYVTTVTVLNRAVYFYQKTKGSLSTTGITLPRTIRIRSRLFADYKKLTKPVRRNPLQLASFWVMPALDGGPALKPPRKEEEASPWTQDPQIPTKF